MALRRVQEHHVRLAVLGSRRRSIHVRLGSAGAGHSSHSVVGVIEFRVCRLVIQMLLVVQGDLQLNDFSAWIALEFRLRIAAVSPAFNLAQGQCCRRCCHMHLLKPFSMEFRVI